MELFKEIENKLKSNKKIIIAIDGPCASGKSTFAKKLVEKYNGSLFHMDDFFLPEVLKTEERLNEIGGNVYYERFKSEIIDKLNDLEISYQPFNCKTQELDNRINEVLNNLIIIEGSYSLHKTLRDSYDIKIMLEVDYEEQLKRLKKRTSEALYKRFVNEWIPLESKYFLGENLEDIVDYKLNVLDIDL